MAEYFAAGRKLTQKGNIALADAKALVPLLGTGDRVDEWIGDKQFKTKSVEDLPDLLRTWFWARKAGVIRVANSRATTTATWAKSARHPLVRLKRIADALLELGPVTLGRETRYLGFNQMSEIVEGLTDELVSLIGLSGDDGIAIDRLAGVVAADADERFVWDSPHWTAERRRKSFAGDVRRLVRSLAISGLAEQLDPEGGEDRARLTALGHWYFTG